MNLYNLDLILSVGYRVNSKKATQFRQWATQHLKDFLIKGYAINEQRLLQQEKEVQFLKSGIHLLSHTLKENLADNGGNWLDHFAKGLKLVDDYDHEVLDTNGATKLCAIFLDKSEYRALINNEA